MTDKSAVDLRAEQTRGFDTTDQSATLRAVVATLQDLGFVVNRADDVMGTVSATKLAGYTMVMTVTLRPDGHQTLIRASAEYNMSAVSDPAPYQQFFAALSKSLFLAANKID